MKLVQQILQEAEKHNYAIKHYLCHDNIFGKLDCPEELKHFQKHEINALYLLGIQKAKDLCCFFKLNHLDLESIINKPVYLVHEIPKKKGGVRKISAPEKPLKKIQKSLNYFLQAYYLWIKPKEVHGFVIHPHYMERYCNIVENAKAHIGKKHVLNIDLKDFFPSISAKRVMKLFSSELFPYNNNIATALTLITTFKGELPTGAPTSPVISNFICYKLDTDIIDFCAERNLTYTRYADDLTFSSDDEISVDTLLDLINIIVENDFKINDKKVHKKTSNQRQTVTGLTVNEKVNIDRKLLKKIRAMLHDLSTNGLYLATARHFRQHAKISNKHEVKFLERLLGYINFVGQVRGLKDPLYQKMKSDYEMFIEILMEKRY